MKRVVKTQNIDSEKLELAIKNSGYRPGYIVEQLGISKQAFDMKRKGRTAFRGSEIYVLVDLLKLTDQEKNEIFFPEMLG
jgi:hypothetical protein